MEDMLDLSKVDIPIDNECRKRQSYCFVPEIVGILFFLSPKTLL